MVGPTVYMALKNANISETQMVAMAIINGLILSLFVVSFIYLAYSFFKDLFKD